MPTARWAQRSSRLAHSPRKTSICLRFISHPAHGEEQRARIRLSEFQLMHIGPLTPTLSPTGRGSASTVRDYGIRIDEPVVLRFSRSTCAFWASLSAYVWLTGILTLPLATTRNRSP